MSTIAERVAKGVAFLDGRDPGWDQRIDLDALDLRAPCDCILGQLVTDFADDGWGTVLDKFGLRRSWGPGTQLTDIELGFNAGGEQSNGDFDDLTAEWKRVIGQRRAAS